LTPPPPPQKKQIRFDTAPPTVVHEERKNVTASEDEADYDQDEADELHRSSEEMSDDEFLKQIEGKGKKKKGEVNVDLDNMTKR